MKKTALYQDHLKDKAKMIDFFGWSMPVSYMGIIQEHRQVRSSCGLFDVSHMGILDVNGTQAEDFLQYLTINDVACLKSGRSQYTMMCNNEGTILDDMICTRYEQYFRLVVNCSNFEKIIQWMRTWQEKQFEKVNIIHRQDLSIIALQGPRTLHFLDTLFEGECPEKSFHVRQGLLNGIPVDISRTGYTGECGVELFVDNEKAEQVWTFCRQQGIMPVGLGARDTLRIEAGLPLYGHEIFPGISPFDIGYGWIVKLDKGDFIGRKALTVVKEERKYLYGIDIQDRIIPRQGCEVGTFGQVTSGTFAPSLNRPVAMMISKDRKQVGSPVTIKVRKHQLPGVIKELPFVKKGC